jgi:hypothetical protein
MEVKEVEAVVKLQKYIDSVVQGIGRLVVAELLVDLSNSSLLVIGPPGTGKSLAMSITEEIVRKAGKRKVIRFDGITVNGLKDYSPILSNSNTTILIDELSKGQTEYRRSATLLVFAELVYTGYYRIATAKVSIEIENFKGSAIINSPSYLMKEIFIDPVYETDIRDKMIRYYHISRPMRPITEMPNLDTEEVNNIIHNYTTTITPKIPQEIFGTEEYKNGIRLFMNEFTMTRAKEHFDKLIKACAIINGRDAVRLSDVELVKKLFINFIIENDLFEKQSLEGPRYLNENLIPALSMLFSYPLLTLEDFETTFQVKETQVRRILGKLDKYLYVKDRLVIPTDFTKNLIFLFTGDLA